MHEGAADTMLHTIKPENCGVVLIVHFVRLKKEAHKFCPHNSARNAHGAVSLEYGCTAGTKFCLCIFLLAILMNRSSLLTLGAHAQRGLQ